MKKISSTSNWFFLIFSFSVITFENLKPEFMANKYDALCQATVRGLEPYHFSKEVDEKSSFGSFNTTPYFQDATSSWNSLGSKELSLEEDSKKLQVGILEELGFFNIAGVFYGFSDLSMRAIATDPGNQVGGAGNHFSKAIFYAPENFKVHDGSGANQGLGKKQLSENAKLLIGEDNWTDENYHNYYLAFLKSIYSGIDQDKLNALSEESTGGAGSFDATNTNLESFLIPGHPNFDDENITGTGTTKFAGLRRFFPNIKRYGARMNATATIFQGVKAFVRTGVCDLKVTPQRVPHSPIPGQTSGGDEDFLNSSILGDEDLRRIGSDLGISFSQYRIRTFEDTYFGITAGHSFGLKDEDGEHVVNICPTVSAGVWAPTSKDYSSAHGNSNAFYIPVGNEGHTGVSTYAAVALELLETVCFSIGGGGTFFNTKSISNYRVPNHRLQRGVYPFKMNIERRKGEMAYAFASFKAIDFLKQSSFYCDYVYMSQYKDKITLKDSSSDRINAFEKDGGGKEKLEKESQWSTQEFSAGIEFRMASSLDIGFGFKANAKGFNTPRMKSFMGQIRFIF